MSAPRQQGATPQGATRKDATRKGRDRQGDHTDPAADPRPVLVTGGAGFIGSNLAHSLAGQGHRVVIYDAMSRPGVARNLDWLRRNHGDRIIHVQADIRDADRLAAAVNDAKAVFHLAAQVAVTSSMTDPRADMEINLLGTINLLEALRLKGSPTPQGSPTPLIFASTNKVYGDLADLDFVLEGEDRSRAYVPVDPAIRASGIGEARPLDFHTPYGCSKGAADQYVLDYARSFGLQAAVLRMSCIYGQRQMGTEDQGWVAHFLIRALNGQPITLYGDGFQVRDILDVADAVAAYRAAWARIDAVSGQAFNLGGGPRNAVSLHQLLDFAATTIGRPIDIRHAQWRNGDQRYFVADTTRAKAELGLDPETDWKTGVRNLAKWLQQENSRQNADKTSIKA